MAKSELEKQRAAARAEMYAVLDKKLGKGLGRAVEDQEIEPLVRQSFGSVGADWVSGGGVPYGRITEIYGAEGSGKTTLALSFLAQAQRDGHQVALIDAEHGFDPEWGALLGLDVNQLFFLQPDNGEQGLEALEIWIAHGVTAIVVDSVSALVPKAEIESGPGKEHMGRQAKLMSAGLRRMAGMIAKAEAAVVFINQLREKIGVMFGSPETTSGGKALKFYASLRLDCRRGKILGSKEDQTGTHIRLKTVKNRGNAQFRKREIPLVFGMGLDAVTETVDLAVEAELIQKSGAWYSYGDTRIGQGQAAAADWFRDKPEVLSVLTNKVVTFLDTGEIISSSEEPHATESE